MAKKRRSGPRSAAQVAAQKKAAAASAKARAGKGGADRRASLATIVKRSVSSPGKTRNPWATPANEAKWAANDAKLHKAAEAARALQQTPAFKSAAKKLGPNASHEQIVEAMKKNTRGAQMKKNLK